MAQFVVAKISRARDCGLKQASLSDIDKAKIHNRVNKTECRRRREWKKATERMSAMVFVEN